MHPQIGNTELKEMLFSAVAEIANRVYDERTRKDNLSNRHYPTKKAVSSSIERAREEDEKIEFLIKNENEEIDMEALKKFHDFFIDNRCFLEKYPAFESLIMDNGTVKHEIIFREKTYVLVYLFDRFWGKIVSSKDGLYGMLMKNFLDKKKEVLDNVNLKSILCKYKKTVINYHKSTLKYKKPEIVVWDEKADQLLHSLIGKK